MKTVFVINKKAGTGKKFEKVLEDIKKIAEESALNYEIYYTKSMGDAKDFVMDFSNTYGPARFIACGGDGTLNEVINGAIHLKENEIGVIPLGTGNDFCRNFDVDFLISKLNLKENVSPVMQLNILQQ